jgi:hypothetical protein
MEVSVGPTAGEVPPQWHLEPGGVLKHAWMISTDSAHQRRTGRRLGGLRGQSLGLRPVYAPVPGCAA